MVFPSAINSCLSYLARIHCSFKTLKRENLWSAVSAACSAHGNCLRPRGWRREHHTAASLAAQAARASQPGYCSPLGLGNPAVGTVLCSAGCLPASLASTSWMPVALPPQGYPDMFSDIASVSWGKYVPQGAVRKPLGYSDASPALQVSKTDTSSSGSSTLPPPLHDPSLRPGGQEPPPGPARKLGACHTGRSSGLGV